MAISQYSSSNNKQHRARVFIVDDMPQVCRDLRQLLELTGEVEIVGEAANADDAIRLAAELAPDVVIMDVEMPGMDGFEATRQIKERGLAPRVVILSVHADPENVDRARAIGADEFVVKGANFKILVRAILGWNITPNSAESE